MPIGSRYYLFPMTQLNADSSGSGETASHFDGRLLIGNIFAGTISSSFDRMNQTMACRLVMVLIPWITIARCTKLFPFPWFTGTIYSPWLRRGPYYSMGPAWYETISFALFFFLCHFFDGTIFCFPMKLGPRTRGTRLCLISRTIIWYLPLVGTIWFAHVRSVTSRLILSLRSVSIQSFSLSFLCCFQLAAWSPRTSTRIQPNNSTSTRSG